MFDVAPTELLIVAVVALVVIGPKDLPKTMRVVGRWVGKARGVARHFRSGFDAMVREAEMEEMEKRWAEENARIMREHPAEAVVDQPVMRPLPPPEGDTTAGEGTVAAPANDGAAVVDAPAQPRPLP